MGRNRLDDSTYVFYSRRSADFYNDQMGSKRPRYRSISPIKGVAMIDMFTHTRMEFAVVEEGEEKGTVVAVSSAATGKRSNFYPAEKGNAWEDMSRNMRLQ